MSKEVKVMAAIGAVVVLGSIWLFMKGGNSTGGTPVDEQALVRTESHSTAAIPNKVTLVEFGDFQCPACATAYPIIKLVKENYQSNPEFSFVYRQFPLTGIHPNAFLAAQASEAAAEQGKFWEMHDKLFENQKSWESLTAPVDVFVQYARELSLDPEKFRSELVNGKYQSRVNEDIGDANTLGLNSTPSFFLNGERLQGIPSYNDLVEKIDALLAQ